MSSALADHDTPLPVKKHEMEMLTQISSGAPLGMSTVITE